jgi:glycosyltransferase involved in cell wall biosynthesis
VKIIYTVNDPLFFLSHRLPLAKNAINKNWQVFLVSDFSNVDKKDFVDHHIKTIHIPLNRNSTSILKNITSFLKLLKSLKKISPDIIHNITLKMTLLGSLCLFFGASYKTINAISGLGYLFTNSRFSFSKLLVSLIFRAINFFKKPHYIFQNNNDKKVFEKLGVKNNHSLIRGSGVDKQQFNYHKPSKNKKINITFTGRILKDKGILELIKAVEILSKEFRSKVVLNIYGKIDLDNPAHITEKELKKLLKPNFIVWHGNTNDIKSVLALSDIYCLPSYREGLPKSTLEAMAIGRPIITTNAPGCEDTVLEGINGFKVDMMDHIALSEKLQLLIEDKPLRIKMGKKSREIFEENFTLDKVVKQTFELYDSLIVKN